MQYTVHVHHYTCACDHQWHFWYIRDYSIGQLAWAYCVSSSRHYSYVYTST